MVVNYHYNLDNSLLPQHDYTSWGKPLRGDVHAPVPPSGYQNQSATPVADCTSWGKHPYVATYTHQYPTRGTKGSLLLQYDYTSATQHLNNQI